MKKAYILTVLLPTLLSTFVYSQVFCSNLITGISKPTGSPIEIRQVDFQSMVPWSAASASVRNISGKPIEEFSVSLSDAGIKGLSLSFAASPGLPLSRQRELVRKGKSLDEIPHGDLRSPIAPLKEVFVHSGFGRVIANCPATLHVLELNVKFSDKTWYHYKAPEEFSAAESGYIPGSLKGYPNLAEQTFFATVVVDKTGKGKIESISSSRPEDEEVFQKIVSGWEFHPALMSEVTQEDKVSVIVAITRSRLDYVKLKELLVEHGPSVVMVIEWEPRGKRWLVE
jgi:hypothetical protein